MGCGQRHSLANGKELISMKYHYSAGFADGIRADADGNIWASAGWVGDGYDGVHIFSAPVHMGYATAIMMTFLERVC